MVASVALLSITLTILSLLFSLVFDGGFHIRSIHALFYLHDNLIVIIPVIGIIKPVLGNNNGRIGADIETHSPFLNNTGDPQRSFLAIGPDGDPGADFDIMILGKGRSDKTTGIPTVVIPLNFSLRSGTSSGIRP